ncbi:GlcG/HbpS family heme-binding protein [Sphingobium nicotianae]|uniref:Heme-binding protein n=1 Tax=Sphingobium nicotianae TaxID=2782607 RepID=A0A9X1IQC1_9SPHN|nr:heme-binding protein [Sphingobium nicotianae]MBT2186511.1 heme-binding protein [Sphingobium nicotianae]
MGQITLSQANAIIAGAFAKGAEARLNPLSVVVTDAGGHLIAFQRQDGASFGRAQIATGKAAGALAIGASSRRLGVMAEERPWFLGAFTASAPHPVIPAAGGVIVVDASGAFLGAVGVTGDTSDNDEAAALAGIAAAGLKAQG